MRAPTSGSDTGRQHLPEERVLPVADELVHTGNIPDIFHYKSAEITEDRFLAGVLGELRQKIMKAYLS
jgi:hypothetical protein